MKYKLNCKTIEIKSDLTKLSVYGHIFIDNHSLQSVGRGVSNIIYEGKSPELPQIFIEGNPELMTDFILERLEDL